MTTATRRVLVAVPILAALIAGGAACAPTPSTSTAGAVDKPPRPTSSATTDEGKCQDYGQAALDAEAGDARAMPPLRLALTQDQVRLLFYANDTMAVTCWLSGDEVLASPRRNATAVNDETYPPGQLSYSSEDSGRGWGGAAFGRVPAGTTMVTISFPTGADQTATIDGEWFGYLADPGPDNVRLAEVTKVTATTPSGPLSHSIQHG